MKKIIITMLATILLLSVSLVASAQEAMVLPKLYDPNVDVPNGELPANGSDGNQGTPNKGQLTSAKLLPLKDSAVLWYGTYEYADQKGEASFQGGYDRDIPRTDAYAVALDESGNRLWSLRICDPQSENEFAAAWILPDDRIMLKFNDRIGEWGTQYYIVSQTGEVQEMTPSFKAKEYGVNETLRPLRDGILGGGLGSDHAGYGPMETAVNITFFDYNMNVVWNVDDDTYIGAEFLAECEVKDGIVLAGGIVDLEASTTSQPWYAVPIAIKVDSNGEVEWEYRGHEYAVGPFQGTCATDDGGVLLSGWVNPTEPTAFDDSGKGTITKLNAEGKLVWSRQYFDDYSFESLDSIISYKDGYVAAGYTDNQKTIALLYLDSAGNPIEKIVMDVDADTSYLQLIANEYGSFLYGAGITMRDETTTSSSTPFHLPLVNIWK